MAGTGVSGREGETNGEQDSLAPTWRHLPFYGAEKVRDAADFGSSPSPFRSPNEIASISNSSIRPRFVNHQGDGDVNGSTSALPATPGRRQSVLVGDIHGKIRVLDAETYADLGSWQAFHGSPDGGMGQARVTHLSCDEKGRVVTLGEDEGARFPMIRIWDLSTLAKASNGTHYSPRLLTEGKVQHGSRPHPIAALAHTPSLSFLSIGLADGSVLLLRGLDEALQLAGSTNVDSTSPAAPSVTLPKFKVAFQPPTSKGDEAVLKQEAVTGLGFAEHHSLTATVDGGKAAGRKAVVGGRGRNGVGAGKRSLANAGFMDRRGEKEGPAETVNLFIVTLSRILRYTVLGKGAGLPASVVDDVGCALGCAQLVPNGIDPMNSLQGKIVVARDEAIYVVGAEGREMSLAYEGPKSSIRLAATQLVIVSPPMAASAASNSATVRHYVAGRDRSGKAAGRSGPTGGGLGEVSKVTIFDLDNKLIAYSSTFEGGVREAWVGSNGDICVLGDDGVIARLEEKTLRQKLDLLFRKSLFLLAVNVAKSHASRSIASTHEVDNIEPLLADIYRKYGDSLYEKGDFEGAMNQFVKTIGFTQPSYVIRKFLDAQRITNLTTYLQELHARGMANSDHTTLLLNCYTKLKDVTSLDRFIKRPLESSSSREEGEAEPFGEGDEDLDGVEKEELPFDLETAIRVCRQAGYFEHAAYLAKRYDQHDEYIRIQIEDLSDFENAINHIRGLSAEEAERNLLRYGKAMLDEIPKQTTELLIELCSGAFQPTPMAVGAGVNASKVNGQGKSAAAAYLTYLQVGGFGKSAPAEAERGAEASETPSATTAAAEGESGEDGEAIHSLGPLAAYSVPLPRLFFAHFIAHPLQFQTFLETVALARWGQSVDMDEEGQSELVADISYDDEGEYMDQEKREQQSIWNTLLELFLTLARPSSHPVGKTTALDGAQRLLQKSKALQLLRQYKQLPYDISQALMVCSQEAFTEGVVFLYERQAMYEDVLYLYMDQDSERGQDEGEEGQGVLMGCLARYGSRAPQLYSILLRYLASSEQLLSRHQEDLEKILSHIEEERLMSPLEVVQTLSRKGVASVGLIRSYLVRSIQAQQVDIETNEKLTSTYRLETREKTKEIDSLKDVHQPKVFQQTKCNACSGSLDLPIIHFMCKHSFHSRCLGEEEKECPLCAKSHGIILEIRKNNLAFGERQDLFLNEVEEAEDGFDVVASMFSKGLFGAQQLGERA